MECMNDGDDDEGEHWFCFVECESGILRQMLEGGSFSVPSMPSLTCIFRFTCLSIRLGSLLLTAKCAKLFSSSHALKKVSQSTACNLHAFPFVISVVFASFCSFLPSLMHKGIKLLNIIIINVLCFCPLHWTLFF